MNLNQLNYKQCENNSQYKPGRKKLKMTAKEKQKLLNTLTKEMQAASRALEFEKAAELRDVIFELQNEKNSKKRQKKPKIAPKMTGTCEFLPYKTHFPEKS